MITLKPSQYSIPARTARPVKYVATFSDGQQTQRCSTHVYTHAWRLTWTDAQGPHYAAGFSGSRELAREASASWERRAIKNAGATGCKVEIVEVQK